jgi:Flp pilus assembly secretin CpaC
MVRAFAVCAVILLGSIASANDAATAKDVAVAAEPTVALIDGSPASACREHDCATAKVAAVAEKPTDKHALLKQKLAEMNCLQSEIDELRIATGTPRAILVKMKVTEVSRTKLRELGVEFDDLMASGRISKEQLDWLKKNNAAKILSEPNIAVTCGRPASFIVGGEVPMPTVPGSQQAVEFKRHGTEIDLLAIAQGENRVRLEVRARVSEIDEGHEIDVAGKRVPGFNVRQVDSAVDTEMGKTVAVSGSVQRRQEAIQVGGKVSNVESEVELVFLVTPEAVEGNRLLQASTETPYRTATSTNEARPGERSLRVTKPRTPR